MTRTRSRLRRNVVAAAAALAVALPLSTTLAPLAIAHEYKAGAIRIDHPWARPTQPGQQNGAVYLKTVVNRGKDGDRLVRASTPVAERVELHTMSMDGNVMRMREVADIPVPAGQTVKLEPGGLHLMLMGLKQPLKLGDTFPVTLEFERGGRTEVKVWVQQPKDAPAAGHGAHKH